jgi:hypothetical protein
MRNRLKKIFKYFVSDEYIRARTESAMRQVGYTPEFIQDRKLKTENDTI